MSSSSKSKRKQKSTERPRRRCGVTEEPDMDVVIGYNVYPEGQREGKTRPSPIILLNAEPDLIKEHGLPGFEGVRDSKRVLYRRVAGNNFFHELVKTNANNERVFLICETKENKLENLHGRNYAIAFVGRQGQEVLQIKPSGASRESAIIIYKDQELGRITKSGDHGSADSETAYVVEDAYAQKIFEVRKSYQYLKNTICCLPRPMRKVANGLAIYAIENGEAVAVGTINHSQITFCTEVELVRKSLLFATLICIKTKALESS